MARLPLLLALALAGVLAAQLWQPFDDTPATPPPPPSARPAAAVPVPAGERPRDLVSVLLARPLFTPGRRPPRGGPAAAGAGPAGLPRLTGVLVDGASRRAILVPAPGGKPMVAAEGAQVGDFVVERIEPGQVTLGGPGGTRVLRPSFDPSRPPARPAAEPVPGMSGLIGLPGTSEFETAR